MHGRGTAAPEGQSGRYRELTDRVWVLCCLASSQDRPPALRAYASEARAREDLDLLVAASDVDWTVVEVPYLEPTETVMSAAEGAASAAMMPSEVQVLALSWLAEGARAEEPLPVEDPVVISPEHTRGFLSVPPEEWRDMERRGWIEDGRITEAGREAMPRKVS